MERTSEGAMRSFIWNHCAFDLQVFPWIPVEDPREVENVDTVQPDLPGVMGGSLPARANEGAVSSFIWNHRPFDLLRFRSLPE